MLLRNVKLYVIVIPIFNVVLLSDKDENSVSNGEHFVLFHFSSSHPGVFHKKDVLRHSAKFRVKYLCQSLFFSKVAGLKQINNLTQVPASLVFATISEFSFPEFSRHTIYKQTDNSSKSLFNSTFDPN